MPSLNELPSGITKERFIRALEKVGFEISRKGGKGSHYKAIWPASQKFVTVQYDFRKDVLYKILKQVKDISGVCWEEIKKKL
jgi:predicted RNA binding protein YcfA (HicA-like mRNA interferase family)